MGRQLFDDLFSREMMGEAEISRDGDASSDQAPRIMAQAVKYLFG